MAHPRSRYAQEALKREEKVSEVGYTGCSDRCNTYHRHEHAMDGESQVRRTLKLLEISHADGPRPAYPVIVTW